MARPIELRTKDTLLRDIASLKRLRDALAMDSSLDTGRVDIVIANINQTISSLNELMSDSGLRQRA